MRRLWQEINDHRRPSALFLTYWLAAWAVTALTWSGGMGALAVILHLFSPVIAGGMMGWWRAPEREGLLVGRGHLAGGPLAGALVMLANVALTFVAAAVAALLNGTWEWAGFVEWLAFSAAFGLLGLVLGLGGALVGSAFARGIGESRRT